MSALLKSLPVTTIVRSKPKVGFEKEAVAWLHLTADRASNFQGHVGSDIFEALNDKIQREFAVIFHFDTYENLMRWEASEERAEQIKVSQSLFEEARPKMQFAGLDYWFEFKDAKIPAPKWKMAAVTIVIIFTLLNTLIPLLRQLLTRTGWPILLNSLVSMILMVGFMSYVIMPFVTKILAGWLFKNNGTATLNND